MLYIFLFLLSFVFNINAVELHNPSYLYRLSKIKPQDYYVSEKYDGVRAYWDGSKLYTKNHKVIAVPPLITKNWPKSCLDGELWLGKNQLANTVSIVNKTTNSNVKQWQKIKFMVFDQPCSDKTFADRYNLLKQQFVNIKADNLFLIKQQEFSNIKEIDLFYNNLLKNKAEGIILHKKNSFLAKFDRHDLYKIKPFTEGSAVVLKVINGSKSFAEIMGSLLVKDQKTGMKFKIGIGFTKKERINPPPLNSVIIYKHQGYTKNKKPRLPVFVARKK